MRTALVVALAALAACTVRTTNGGIDVDPVSDRIGDWDGELRPVANSGVRGAVAVRSALVSTGASVSIAGATSGSNHPWHIHRGTCANDLGIVGDPAAYPTLQVGAAGTATASARLNVGLDEGQTYFVNVHRSPADLATIVACGPIRH